MPAFTALPGWLARQKWFQALVRGYFTVLRRLLLRGVASAVDLVASAHGSGGEVRRWVKAGDGMAAAGYGLAAMTEAIAAKQDWEGVRFIDDVTDLEAIVARANALAGTEVLTVSEPLTGTGVPATTRAA